MPAGEIIGIGVGWISPGSGGVDKGWTGSGGGALGLVAINCFQVAWLEGWGWLGGSLNSGRCGKSRIMASPTASRPSEGRSGSSAMSGSSPPGLRRGADGAAPGLADWSRSVSAAWLAKPGLASEAAACVPYGSRASAETFISKTSKHQGNVMAGNGRRSNHRDTDSGAKGQVASKSGVHFSGLAQAEGDDSLPLALGCR